MNLSRMEGKKREIVESSADLVAENRELEEQLKELKENRTRLEEEAGRLEDLGLLKNREVEEYTVRLEILKEEREQKASALSQVQLKAAQVKQQDSFTLENIKRVREEAEKLMLEKEELTAGGSGSSQAIEKKQAEIESLRAQIEEALSTAGKLEQSMAGKIKDKEEKTGRQKSFFDKREGLSERMNLLDKDLFRLQNQKEKLSERIENQTNYMWSEYELTWSTAEKLRQEELNSVPEMKKQIEQLKSQIRALGSVNVNAIEDYKEVSERYEFMKTQHDDLIMAEETLLKIIDELDSGMRRQFEEKFREIRMEFDKVFKEMFGGGHGTLELQEDEDILEAGIQIISQPPGKKLQNMMQLSGGEKALTAIALLFAIQNLKPSPFCLLDEIEAALDDSNVDRFAGYLHKLTKYTQFIVITHRRGTMVASDRLYGITRRACQHWFP